MTGLAALLVRDVRILLAGGGALLPVLFYLAVAMLYPFAVGPQPQVLAETAGALAWIAALLAALLPLERLIRPDLERGFFDQFAIRGIAPELVLSVRMMAHWAAFAVPLILATPVAGALMGLPMERLPALLISLLVGTPGLAALGMTIAALTARLGGGTALAGLLILPLAVPVLIFGAGSVAEATPSALALTGAASLLLVAICPFAAGAALRIGHQ